MRGHDYCGHGAYFVTICTHNRQDLFGEVIGGVMELNEYGGIVREEWLKTGEIRFGIELDAFVVMPNHFHGILVVNNVRGTARRAPTMERFGRPVSGSIPTIVRSFKSAVTRRINEARDTPGAIVWQRNYYEHIVRNEDDFNRIIKYIADNPLNWYNDEHHSWAGTRRAVPLTDAERRVIVEKGTEAPFTGRFNDFFGDGVYVCRRCGAVLYKSSHKFRSHCGWPSFDDEIPGAVRRVPDADGRRTEIVCAACGAHLGHVFGGEYLTPKNLRHCVNSISLDFVSGDSECLKKAYFAGGCFWGIEHLFNRLDGVVSAVSGYMGGDVDDPSYEQVCGGDTGHLEAVEVCYDPGQVAYEDIARYFFEIHDPTQPDGQGPDIGQQYLSAAFYNDSAELETLESLVSLLKGKGYDIVTRLLPSCRFWKAEEYHQNYYAKTGKQPYCHLYTKRF